MAARCFNRERVPGGLGLVDLATLAIQVEESAHRAVESLRVVLSATAADAIRRAADFDLSVGARDAFAVVPGGNVATRAP